MDINSRKVITLLIMTIFSAILILVPQIDLHIQQVFWDQHYGFFLKDNTYIMGIYKIVPKLTSIWVIALLLLWAILWIMKKKFWDINRKKICYLLLCLALGPGLFVNTIFKDNFGRARPSQITEFGGEKPFSRAFEIAKNCPKNCSFVSGHASVGFYFTAISFITGGVISSVFFFGSLFLGFLIGLVRIAQGGHFFSDVFFSGVIVIAINYFLYMLFFNIFKKKAKNDKRNNS